MTSTAPTAGSLPLGGSPTPTTSPWLHGPLVDILCGYGLLYVISIPLLVVIGRAAGIAQWPIWLVPAIALAVSTPHYGATLLRVYDSHEDRRRYVVFSLYLTIFLVLCFAAGLYDVVLGSWLITLYVSWSPWHFAGQNYGLAVMSLRRRGVPIGALAKRLLYASFLLSFVLAFVAIHTLDSRLVFSQGVMDDSVFRVIRLGIPVSASIVLALVVGTAYLVVTALALGLLGRGGHARDLGPTLLLLLTQGLWFSVPALERAMGTHVTGGLAFTAIWISTAHALQYLWVTSYFARQSDEPAPLRNYLLKCLLGGAAVTLLPPLLFTPGLLGWTTPLAGGVAVLSFSVLNIHHFVLDGAVWKLRDGRVARALLGQGGPLAADVSGRHRLRPFVWALGSIALAYPFYLLAEGMVVLKARSPAVVEASVARLAWLGRDHPVLLARVANAYEEAGQPERAIDVYRRCLVEDPSMALAARNLSRLLVEHADSDRSRPLEAIRVARAASAAAEHRDPAILLALGSANQAAGRSQAAEKAWRRALQLARARGDRSLALSAQRLLGAHAAARGG